MSSKNFSRGNTLFPVLLDHIHDNSMVLMLFQTAHNDNGRDSLNSTYADRDAAPMDCILVGLFGVDSILGPERILVTIELAVHQPGAAAEAEHGVPLSAYPDFVVR